MDSHKKMRASFDNKDQIQLEIFRHISSNGSPFEYLTIYGEGIELFQYKYTKFEPMRTIYQPITIKNLARNTFKVQIQIKVADMIQEREVKFTTRYPKNTLSQNLQDILQDKIYLAQFSVKKRISKKKQMQINAVLYRLLGQMYHKDKEVYTLALKSLKQHKKLVKRLLATQMSIKTASLLTKGLKHNNHSIKKTSIEFLGYMAKRAYTTASRLYTILKDKDPYIRIKTIQALAKIVPGSRVSTRTKQRIVSLLTSIAYKDSHIAANIAAIEAIKKIDGSK